MQMIKKKAERNVEEFLEHRRKKRWIEQRSGSYCFKLYARSLYITWGGVENWIWNCFKETSEENIEVAKLSHVCWLDVRGKLEISDLSTGVAYEIVYIVKLTKGATGWELPITLRLSVPGKSTKERQISLLDRAKARGEWIELNVGSFVAEDGETGEVCFDLYEHGGHWKTGLLIQSAVIRPLP
ncbi:Phloem protein 2-like [Dillenia turbinata]|uniref:Phloem protein 2-like n=1 Tax=Dillenia turbinata TaxID=194707 RepID=A0AAN8YZM4_9MAGN